ncbi:hypothetical protein Godav_025836 [Gossypium davidsonii]|nr:hypothetical protein [Gossypium davidsonii]
MCKHRTPYGDDHPEKPDRITVIWNKLELAGILQRCVILNAKEAKDEYICAVHSKNHVNLIRNISSKEYSKRNRIASKLNSIYLNEGSSESAYLAAGSVIEVAEKVAKGELNSAFAIVRPPGHHAEYDEAMGFCLFNNIAIAASFLLDQRPELGINKILIVDWDVHHGNGTQKTFWSDPRVLFFSVHRHEFGRFYPANFDGFYTMVGEGPGAGYNINVPWENGRCGDADYIAVWDHVLVPVAKEFNPDIILVSAGFDAAVGDPLGGCRLTPHGYSVLLKKLMDFAQGRIVLALEGGYNLDSIANSALACMEVLLEDKPISELSEAYPFESTWRVIQAVRQMLSAYWPTLADKLPTKLTDQKAPPHILLSSSESDDEDDDASKIISKDLVQAIEDVVEPILNLKIEDYHGNEVKSKFFCFGLSPPPALTHPPAPTPTMESAHSANSQVHSTDPPSAGVPTETIRPSQPVASSSSLPHDPSTKEKLRAQKESHRVELESLRQSREETFRKFEEDTKKNFNDALFEWRSNLILHAQVVASPLDLSHVNFNCLRDISSVSLNFNVYHPDANVADNVDSSAAKDQNLEDPPTEKVPTKPTNQPNEGED